MSNTESAPRFVGAVANAVTILRSLAHNSEPSGVAAISRNSGVSVSTCFNILRTLTNERLVMFDAVEKTYRIGMGVLELSIPLLGASHADLIRPELARLAEQHKVLICLWNVTEDERILLIDRIFAAGTVRVDMSPGSRLPAFAGAVGRCYAAIRNLNCAELKLRFDKLQWQSPPAFRDYTKEVDEAKKNGFAFDFGHLFSGIDTAGAVITDTAGKPRLGLSGIAISGQVQSREMDRLGTDLRDTADWVSETLFGSTSGARRSNRLFLGRRQG